MCERRFEGVTTAGVIIESPASIDVVHSVGDFPPHACGGTEVYVSRLTQALSRQGLRSVVIVPQSDLESESKTYWHQGQQVIVYRSNRDSTHDQSTLRAVLSMCRRAIYHQHAWQPDLASDGLACAQRAGLSSVLTLHTSAAYCLRHDFTRLGRTACDHQYDSAQCARCTAEQRGLAPWLSKLTGMLPPAASEALSEVLPGRAGTGAGLRVRAQNHLRAFDSAVGLAAKIIVPSQWQLATLRQRGMNTDKLVYLPHGVDFDMVDTPRSRTTDDAIHCVYAGRIAEEKGIDLLLAAWQCLPDALPIVLHIFGAARSDGGARCLQRIRSASAQDQRIRYHGALSERDIVRRLRDIADLVLVPSQVMETGPQVVLEASAASVPVIGSRLGGIAEWVEDGINGRLLPARQAAVWASVLRDIHNAPSTLVKWRRMVRQPRSMSDVARELVAVYAQLRVQSTTDRASVPLDSFHHHSGLQRRPFPS